MWNPKRGCPKSKKFGRGNFGLQRKLTRVYGVNPGTERKHLLNSFRLMPTNNYNYIIVQILKVGIQLRIFKAYLLGNKSYHPKYSKDHGEKMIVDFISNINQKYFFVHIRPTCKCDISKLNYL